MSEESAPSYVVVPLDKISDEALHGLINEFILREGTDYGAREFTLIEKHAQIKKQLASGHILIVFETVEQTASIVRKEEIRN